MSQQNLGNLATYQKTEPFLWIHLALLAAVPIAVVLCMMGLAVGDPVFPGWLETLLLGIPPIALTVWLQWQNPLYPFSTWVLAKPPTELSDDRRRVLSVLRRRINGWYIGGWIAAIAGLFMYVVFRQIYSTAPLAADIAPFPPALRLLGILWAEVFFLIANLLWQMGISAVRVMLVPPPEFSRLAPYERDRISKEFTIIGKRSPDLLSLEPLAPIQQTAELITEPESSATTSNPLLAKLSGLIDKVTNLLPGGNPTTVAKSAPARAPKVEAPEKLEKPEESDRKEAIAEPVEVADKIEEITPTETEVEAVEKVEEVDQVETKVAAETEEITQPENKVIEKTEEPARTEETEVAEAIITVDTLTADLTDATQAETKNPASTPENNENIDSEGKTDISDTATAETADSSSNPQSDDEWV